MNANVDLSKLSQAELIKLVLEARNETRAKITFKVSEKGAVSIFGLQRFPVTLYKSQWEHILSKADELKKFMADNKDKLAVKGE